MAREDAGHDAPDWSVYRTPTAGDRAAETDSGPLPEPGRSSTRRGARRGPLVVVGCGVAAALGIAGLVYYAGRPELAEISYDHVIDPQTYAELLAALERTTGSTEVLEFEAKVYDHGPTIQVVVPPNDEQPLSVTYRWEDGALEHYYADAADPEDVAFDLADISAATLNTLDRETRRAVDDGIAIAGVTIDHDEWDGAVVIESELVDRDLDHFSTFADQDGNVTGTDEWENG